MERPHYTIVIAAAWGSPILENAVPRDQFLTILLAAKNPKPPPELKPFLTEVRKKLHTDNLLLSSAADGVVAHTRRFKTHSEM